MPLTSDLNILLTQMQPELNPGCYAFVTLPLGMELDPMHVMALIRESEGLSVIIPEPIALELGLSVAFTAAWITLTVHSDLATVGFTAAFSQAFAQSGISCNVVAGVHHDHLFVAVEQAQEAMDMLHSLQTSAAQQVV